MEDEVQMQAIDYRLQNTGYRNRGERSITGLGVRSIDICTL